MGKLRKDMTAEELQAAKEYGKKYYQENREKLKLASKEWFEKHKEHCKIRSKRYYEEHKERCLELAKEWTNKNREKVRGAKRKWVENNKERAKAIASSRRKTVRQATPKIWLDKDFKNDLIEYYLDAQFLSQYTGQKMHVDHIVPIKGKMVCGLHVPWNLTIVPADFNLSKSNKIPQVLGVTFWE